MNLVCIVCPNGCRLTVTIDGEDITVTGQKMPQRQNIRDCRDDRAQKERNHYRKNSF